MFCEQVSTYLAYCKLQKNLDGKTLSAYRIDLRQFEIYLREKEYSLEIDTISRIVVTEYIVELHKRYKPRSAKRKIASLKAFFCYLEYEEIIDSNPFDKVKTHYKEPELLPRTISVPDLQRLLSEAYRQKESSNNTDYQRRVFCRDVAVLELLFSTGLRVSELCNLKKCNVNLDQGMMRIYGKGAKERMLYLANQAVLDALRDYYALFGDWIKTGEFVFYNRMGRRLSEQSVRFMIQRYVEAAGLTEHITPHMFRHTFATLLLEEDVDIRYIQQILGHSSITTTQIYTHVAMEKQRCILTNRHPRNRLVIGS